MPLTIRKNLQIGLFIPEFYMPSIFSSRLYHFQHLIITIIYNYFYNANIHINAVVYF